MLTHPIITTALFNAPFGTNPTQSTSDGHLYLTSRHMRSWLVNLHQTFPIFLEARGPIKDVVLQLRLNRGNTNRSKILRSLARQSRLRPKKLFPGLRCSPAHWPTHRNTSLPWVPRFFSLLLVSLANHTHRELL